MVKNHCFKSLSRLPDSQNGSNLKCSRWKSCLCVLYSISCVQNVSSSSVSFNITDSNNGFTPTEVVVDENGSNSSILETTFPSSSNESDSSTTPGEQEVSNKIPLYVAIVVVFICAVFVLLFWKKLPCFQRLPCLSSAKSNAPAARSAEPDPSHRSLLRNR